jgi:hypothetical protein
LQLQPCGQTSYLGFSGRNYQLAINPLFYLARLRSGVAQ